MALEVGQQAPDFALKDEHGQLTRLSDLRGDKNVAVVFYPFAFSGICTGELCELRDNLSVFEADNVQVLAVSCDPVHTLRAWSESEKYPFPLLSDFWPHGSVAQQYGVFNETTGSAVRGTFLLDVEGVLRWNVVNGLGEARSLSAYRDAIAAL
jgi:mycoredoxin-dependent peroxiredoxin